MPTTNMVIPTTKNKYASLVAPLIVLRILLLEKYLQKPSINSPLLKAGTLLLLLAPSFFLPPLDLQQDFNAVLGGINNLRIDAARATTIGDNTVATNPADLDLDSVDLLQDFSLEDIKTVVEVLDTKEGKDANITRSLPKLANFYNLSP